MFFVRSNLLYVLSARRLTISRLPRPFRRRYHQWRTDQDNERSEENAEPLLEREF